MLYIQGFVEYLQLNEWNAVIDVGALLVPNRRLSSLIFGAGEVGAAVRSPLAARGVPPDASVGFRLCHDPHVDDIHSQSFASLEELQSFVDSERETEVGVLVAETNFDVLLRLMDVLGDRFGRANIRMVVFFD